MGRAERIATIAAGFVIPLGLVTGGPFGLLATLAGLLLARRWVPRMWRTIGIGILSGAIAGVLVLGPGFRLAMRVVAMMDPVRVPEFTIEGTLFIVIFVGVVFGGIFGVMVALLSRGLPWPRWAVSAVGGTVVMGFIAFDSELRSEIATLGAGPILNVAMFGGAALLYSVVTCRLAARFEKRWSRSKRGELAEVPA